MKATEFRQSTLALVNSINMALEKSTEETWEENLKEALQPFGADVVSNLDHLTFG